jgi:hypothetical protein
MTFEQMAVVEGGIFWGTESVLERSVNGYTRVCQQDYKFWFKVGRTYSCTDWVPGPQF